MENEAEAGSWVEYFFVYIAQKLHNDDKGIALSFFHTAKYHVELFGGGLLLRHGLLCNFYHAQRAV